MTLEKECECVFKSRNSDICLKAYVVGKKEYSDLGPAEAQEVWEMRLRHAYIGSYREIGEGKRND